MHGPAVPRCSLVIRWSPSRVDGELVLLILVALMVVGGSDAERAEQVGIGGAKLGDAALEPAVGTDHGHGSPAVNGRYAAIVTPAGARRAGFSLARLRDGRSPCTGTLTDSGLSLRLEPQDR